MMKLVLPVLMVSLLLGSWVRAGELEALTVLGIDQKRMENIEAMHYETQKKVIPLKSQLELVELEINKIMRSESPDLDKVKALIKKKHSLAAELDIMHAELKLGINALLTPEERRQLWSMSKEHMGEGPQEKSGCPHTQGEKRQTPHPAGMK